ncbi:MAG TPA: STAS domain-containing protein [Acidimicrobiales bacterium]|nr:STAS domain-containing protein [Acidimicrobiales bacterium]
MPSDPSHLEVVDRAEGRVATRLSGDLDIVTSDDVKRDLAQLVDAGHVALALDLSHVGFVDSSGLGVLVAIHRHAASSGGSLVLRSVPPQVQRLFEITRLADLLTVDGD